MPEHNQEPEITGATTKNDGDTTKNQDNLTEESMDYKLLRLDSTSTNTTIYFPSPGGRSGSSSSPVIPATNNVNGDKYHPPDPTSCFLDPPDHQIQKKPRKLFTDNPQETTTTTSTIPPLPDSENTLPSSVSFLGYKEIKSSVLPYFYSGTNQGRLLFPPDTDETETETLPEVAEATITTTPDKKETETETETESETETLPEVPSWLKRTLSDPFPINRLPGPSISNDCAYKLVNKLRDSMSYQEDSVTVHTDLIQQDCIVKYVKLMGNKFKRWLIDMKDHKSNCNGVVLVHTNTSFSILPEHALLNCIRERRSVTVDEFIWKSIRTHVAESYSYRVIGGLNGYVALHCLSTIVVWSLNEAPLELIMSPLACSATKLSAFYEAEEGLKMMLCDDVLTYIYSFKSKNWIVKHSLLPDSCVASSWTKAGATYEGKVFWLQKLAILGFNTQMESFFEVKPPKSYIEDANMWPESSRTAGRCYDWNTAWIHVSTQGLLFGWRGGEHYAVYKYTDAGSWQTYMGIPCKGVQTLEPITFLNECLVLKEAPVGQAIYIVEQNEHTMVIEAAREYTDAVAF